MSYILHMSDFHFGRDPALERTRLDDLATWIKSNQIHIDYLVFTGDMIDAPTIQTECIRKLKKIDLEKFKNLKPTDDNDIILSHIRAAGSDIISIYDDVLRQVTIQSMKQAGEIFIDFVKQINLDNRRVVLCCGNHDRMRFATEDNFNCDGDCHIDESTLAAPFEAYDALCRIINDNLSHNTMIYSHEGMNFVIANSNWRTPALKETNNMCVSCKSLSELLSQLRESDTYAKNRSFLIAHKPYDDFCESTKYPYTGESFTILQIIERTTEAFLYGDKHSYSVRINNNPKEFMCGLPISSCGVRYNLLDFEPDFGIRSCSYILNDGHGWSKVPITDCIESVYDESKQYLKDYAFILLTGTNTVPVNWDSAIKLMQSAYEKETLAEISKLFTSFSVLRQGKRAINIIEDNFFDEFISLIENSSLQSVGIKGRPGVGKSTFTTIAYLYMLWRFSGGKTRYVPFYFNIGAITANLPEEVIASRNVDFYISYCFKQFSDYFKSCCELSKKNNLRLCLFIDGLEKSKSLAPGDNTIEKRIYQLVETELGNNDRYVMCFNTHDSYHFDSTFDKINRFEYVLFMNRARIIPYKAKEQKMEAFLSAYLSLRQKPADYEMLQKIKKNLIKFRKPSIDLFFLYHCDKHIFEIEENEAIWSVLRTHLTNLENIADRMFRFRIDTVRQAVGLLFSKRKRFTEITDPNNTESLNIVEFLAIINTPILANYLIADYYVQILSQYSDTSDAIPRDAILYSFMPNELSITIRLLLDEKGEAANDMLSRFIDLHKGELDGYLYSSLVYLCGHLRTERKLNLIRKLPDPNRESNNFFALCGRRSYDFAMVVCETNKFPIENILMEFIDNENYRKFNRSYQLHYYQDTSNNAILNQSPWDPGRAPMMGFDFRYSFLALLSKLEPALQRQKPYPLMELDLFTLCDLIYSRLQYMGADAFFYSAKYNQKDDPKGEAIVSRIVMLLKNYCQLYGGKNSTNDRIDAYFSLMYARFTEILKKLAGNKGKDVSIPYAPPSHDFSQILKLTSLARVGWNIDAPGDIKVDSQPVYSPDPETGVPALPIRETLMQHVMESVYIAQMFLPDSIPEEGFQKHKVISMLLLSELGKTYSGDYSPLYSNRVSCRRSEEKGLAHILTLGALDGYAAQPMFFKPFSSESAMDINMRICWEIKMIQMEYKYYMLYDQLDFNEARRSEFEDDFKEPTTSICKKIRELLILGNPDFKGFFNN